jgi:acetyl-CoA hydrolase
MMNLLFALKAAGQMSFERGQSLLDGSHWFGTYRCSDGKFITLGALEPPFYAILLRKLGLDQDPEFADGYDAGRWHMLRQRFTRLFAQRTRAEWCELLEGSDACFAPVLSPEEARRHPHNVARGIFTEEDGMLQANAAPRFSTNRNDVPAGVPRHGQHTDGVLTAAGYSACEIAALRAEGVVA